MMDGFSPRAGASAYFTVMSSKAEVESKQTVRNIVPGSWNSSNKNPPVTGPTQRAGEIVGRGFQPHHRANSLDAADFG